MNNDDRFMLYGSPVSLVLLNRKREELYRGRGYERIPLTEDQMIVKPSRSKKSVLITNSRDLPFEKAESVWEDIWYVGLLLDRDDHVLVSVMMTYCEGRGTSYPCPLHLEKMDAVEFRVGNITLRV